MRQPLGNASGSFIFMGRSGAGKGTQAALLIELLKKTDPTREVIYIQSGQELRQFIQGPTYTERVTKELYDIGGLQPEFIAIYVWAKAIVERYTGTEHLVFDGMARRLGEAKVLGSVFAFYKLPKLTVIHIDIRKEEAVKRLLARKRSDDTREDIGQRLSWYDTDVIPVIDYFRTDPNYRFLEIDGERSIEDIHQDIALKAGLA